MEKLKITTAKRNRAWFCLRDLRKYTNDLIIYFNVLFLIESNVIKIAHLKIVELRIVN